MSSEFMNKHRAIDRQSSLFIPFWTEFVNNEPVSWRYEATHLNYYRKSCLPWLKADLSFILLHEGKPAAICPLFFEEKDGLLSFSLEGGYLPVPFVGQHLGRNIQSKIQAACYAEVDRRAAENNVHLVRMRIDAACNVEQYNILQRYGFIDCSTTTAILDLTKTEQKLRANLRGSYKALINKGRKIFETQVIDCTSKDYSYCDQYQELHFKASGRATRSDESFAMQKIAIKNDKAVLVVVKKDGIIIACAYFLHHGHSVFYGSMADDPDYAAAVPAGHMIIWEAILYYKKRGMRLLEVGVQQFSPQILNVPSRKELNIGMFKRGFGADLLPMFQGVKYYDGLRMRLELQNGVETLCRAFGDGL
jgi:hypothetical protein